MRTFQESLDKRMENANFRREYEAIQPEMDVIRASIDARKGQGAPQRELVTQASIAQA